MEENRKKRYKHRLVLVEVEKQFQLAGMIPSNFYVFQFNLNPFSVILTVLWCLN